MSPRVVLDATPLLFGGAGVGRVTKTLLDFMLEAPDAPEFALYARCLGGPRLTAPAQLPAYHLRAPQLIEPLLRFTGWIEQKTRGDLYHATDHYLPLKYPERCVVTVHDMMFLTHPEADLETHARQRRVVPPFLEKCRKVIAVSEHTRQDILQTTNVPADRIEVIYWAVDRDRFRPDPDPEALRERLARQFGVQRPYFLAVGCSVGRKNTPRLLEAFQRVLEAHPEEQLLLVWSPPPEFAALSDASNGRIRFTGRVTDEQLTDLYAGARCMVYPSLYEGFGLPVLEAMSCGTPVITSKTTSLPEVGGDAVIYVDPEAVESIEDAIGSVCRGDADLAGLTAMGLKRLDTFSWPRTAQQTLGVYRDIL